MIHTITVQDMVSVNETILASSSKAGGGTKKLLILNHVHPHGLHSYFKVTAPYNNANVTLYAGDSLEKAVAAYNDIQI